MRRSILIVLVLLRFSGFAQLSQPYLELRDFAKKNPSLAGDSSFYFSNFYNKGLNYFYPLYKAFIYEQNYLTRDTVYYTSNLAQAVSFTGDYATTLELTKMIPGNRQQAFTKKDIDTMTTVPGVFSYSDAKKYILDQTRSQRVVMINEAHDRPQHRVFTASLLEDMYKQGFRYLAMEMLSNNRKTAVTKLDAYTGFYSTEPIAGELIRKALELGYTLVPYEDTVRSHSTAERERAQAENLINFLKQKDSTAKILVHAGYGHIEENPQSTLYTAMGTWFKRLSGIDPLTIDQTQMTEISGFSGFMSAVYDAWIQKYPVSSPAIAMSNGKPFSIFGDGPYDLCIIHPPAKYTNGRPTWVNMNGTRKETAVNIAFRTAFFLQAYYADEYSPTTIDLRVPADQTYIIAPNGVYYLYLRKGKYKLVFRDKDYKVLGAKDVEVI